MRIIKTTILMMAMAGASAFAEAPTGYYTSCEGLSGASLLSELCDVVGPHTTISYKGLWTLYKTSDTDENGKIWDMYSTKRWTYGDEQCGNYSSVGDCYNREHSFPKSWFDDASPMYSDAFHIYPTDGKVNGQRSNYPFGECSGGTTLASSGGVKALGKLGACTFPGYSGTVFEPDDQYKGDFARSYFYMAAAYNTRISGWDSDMLAGNSYPAYKTWAVNLLLKWHRQDPVSEKELKRNEAVYAQQENRNPFIDHPELAEYVWGDKVGEAWYPGGVNEPEWNTPVDGTTVDFGLTATNYTLSRGLSVLGSNLTEDISVALSGSSAFTLGRTTISAEEANEGCTLTVTYRSATAGESSGEVTFTCGELKSTVTVKAEAVEGIPALPAAMLGEREFTACWMSLGDEEMYSLHVAQDGTELAGYPVAVNAELEEWAVENLEPSTTYTYWLTSETRTSNVVSVTTLTPVPDLQYTEGSMFEFAVAPDTDSEAQEVWIMTENITDDLTVSVAAPFAVSSDMTNWSQSITITADEERFYLRVNATTAGSYETVIDITDGAYSNDEGHATATVVENTTPWFVEDFEDLSDDVYSSVKTYSTTTFVGNPTTWSVVDAGIVDSKTGTTSDKYNGAHSLRIGKTNSSSIASTLVKENGIGEVSLYGKAWSSSDGDVVLEVQYRPEGTTDWITAGSVTFTTTWEQKSVTVNVSGSNYIRLQQTSGKRGSIDDITVGDYRNSSVSLTEGDALAGWTAYSLGGSLVIDSSSVAGTYTVYGVEGREVAKVELSGGEKSTQELANGLYIVTNGEASRTVVVR